MTQPAATVLHVIPHLSLGGASRALIATTKYSRQLGGYHHTAVSLQPPDHRALDLAVAAGLQVIVSPDRITLLAALEQADIVQIYFWNSPELRELFQLPLPAMRTVVWCVINGRHAPHVVPQDLADLSNVLVAASVITLELPLFRSLSADRRALIPCGADFDRLQHLQITPHATFNVGYIGTVDFAKMHPDYVTMSAAIDIPSARFIVAGSGGAFDLLRRQARELGDQRFEFRGYVEDIRTLAGCLDVFGYPLCEDNFSTAELILQEMMYAGVPPVVLPFGGVSELIVHGETGLIAQDPTDYARATTFLYRNPDERARLGRNAAIRARTLFGATHAGRAFNEIYSRLLKKPKRARSQPVQASGPIDGAGSLIRSLGDAAIDFFISRSEEAQDDLLAAESRIACSSASMGHIILEYRNRYTTDGYLRLWAGLILSNRRRPALAVAEFKQAIAYGCSHWRAYWYLARSAEAAGARTVAEDAFKIVRREAPQFAPVRTS